MAPARSGPLQIEHRSDSVRADCGTLLALGPPLVRTLPHSGCNCHSEQDTTSTLGFVSFRGMSLYSSSQMMRHIFFGCHHFDGTNQLKSPGVYRHHTAGENQRRKPAATASFTMRERVRAFPSLPSPFTCPCTHKFAWHIVHEFYPFRRS